MTEPTNDGPEEPAASEPPDNKRDETVSQPPTEEQPQASEPAEPVRTKHSAAGPASVVRWLAAAALVVALGALGVALWALLRPQSTGSSTASKTTSASPTPPPPSPQQIADAKTKTCSAYVTVHNAVLLRANTTVPSEPEAAGANARLAAAAGQSYLLVRIDPATPGPLADAVRRYADNLEEVAIASLAGIGSDDPAQRGRINDWGPINDQITELCK